MRDEWYEGMYADDVNGMVILAMLFTFSYVAFQICIKVCDTKEAVAKFLKIIIYGPNVFLLLFFLSHDPFSSVNLFLGAVGSMVVSIFISFIIYEAISSIALEEINKKNRHQGGISTVKMANIIAGADRDRRDLPPKAPEEGYAIFMGERRRYFTKNGEKIFSTGSGRIKENPRPNDHSYVGEYKEGEYHGQGTLSICSGVIHTQYVGEFKDGEYNGIGTLTRKRVRDGESSAIGGRELVSLISVYVGEFKKGKKNGKGELITGRSKYVGGWKNDKQHGEGTRTVSIDQKGSVIVASMDGVWSNGTFRQGTIINPKYRYMGTLKYRKYDGVGTLISPGNGKYVGEFHRGKRHGKGALYDEGGALSQVGLWENGVFISSP